MVALFLHRSRVCGIGLVYIHTYLHSCSAAYCIRLMLLYFLAGAIYLSTAVICISDFGVVRWCLTLRFLVSEERLDVYFCARGVFCCCCLLQQRGAVCGVRHNIKLHAIQNNDFVPIRTRKNPLHPIHTHIKKQIPVHGNSLYGPASWKHTKADMSDTPRQHPTEHQRTSPPTSRVSEHMPRRPSCVCLPKLSFSRAIATGALEA